MQKRDAPSKKVQFLALLTIICVSATVFGCRGEKPAAPVKPAATAAIAHAQTRTKDQAMAALLELPELKAWSTTIEKASAGKSRGALIEYDANPKVIDGKRYFQLSFVENGHDAAHRWESFLVAENGTDILVEDAATDKTMTLEQWRKDKHPMQRTNAN
jgi:hypothetical protein